MANVRMIAPAGLTGASIGGVEVSVADGVVTVSDTLGSILLSHGFMYETPMPVSEMSRSSLVTNAMAQVRSAVENLSDDVLTQFAAMESESQRTFWDKFRRMYEAFPSVVANTTSETTKADADGVTDPKKVVRGKKTQVTTEEQSALANPVT